MNDLLLAMFFYLTPQDRLRSLKHAGGDIHFNHIFIVSLTYYKLHSNVISLYTLYIIYTVWSEKYVSKSGKWVI